MNFPTFEEELKCFAEDYESVIGCDEAGRGPLAGPVVAAACVLDKNSIVEGGWHARVRDSKTVSEKEREILAETIRGNALAWSVGEVSPEEIDTLNIHNASLLAMQRAVENLMTKMQSTLPARMTSSGWSRRLVILVDGRFEIPNLEFSQKSIIGGDGKILSIAAASIIAKVHRDKIMKNFDLEFPNYGFAKHKGYGTKEHYRAMATLGISPVHRRTFV